MTDSRRILSQAGTSLADVYDVEGSVVGLEALDVSDVKAVHELGGQIHSERLLVFGLQIGSTALAQNLTWDVELSVFPDSINRILSIAVIADVGSRIDNCSVHIRDSLTLRDIPIWMWDSVNDLEGAVRWSAPAVAAHVALRPVINLPGGAPCLLARTGTSRRMPTLFFRGLTSGFGAGTVLALALVNVARPDDAVPAPGNPSSHGLPIPSW